MIVLDDMIADIFSKKDLSIRIKLFIRGTELFIRGRKLNIYFVFITQSWFAAPRNIRLNSMHYFIMKTLNKRELIK